MHFDVEVALRITFDRIVQFLQDPINVIMQDHLDSSELQVTLRLHQLGICEEFGAAR